MKKGYSLTIIFLLLVFFSNAHKLDSLRNNLSVAEGDSVRLQAGIKFARALFKASEYDSSYYYFQQVYELAKANNETKDKLNIVYMMANINYWMGNHTKADSVYQSALAEAYIINDSALISKIHTSIGPNKLKLFDTISAKQNLKLALEMCVQKGIRGNIYANLGQIEREQGNYNTSLNYFQLSEDIWKDLGLSGHAARVLFEKGRVYMAKKEFDKSIEYIRESLLLDSINPYETIQSWKYKRLSESFLELNQFDSAYYNLEKHYRMQNKIYNDDRDKNIKSLELKYQTKLKDQENVSLKTDNLLKESNIETKNILLYTSVILIGLILLFVFLLLKGRKRLSKALVLQEEQKTEISNQSNILEKANHELKDLSKYKETLTAMLVHDLSNPLHMIKASTTDNTIISHANNMITMVDNILTIQKFEEQNVPMDLAKYQLLIIINKAIDQVFVEAERKNVSILNYIQANIYTEVDNLLLVRVFVNLISNALRFTPSNGEIILKAEPQSDETILISVLDTGIGIPKEDLDRIFDKYSQLDSDPEKEIQNYGLGLSFCKLAIESMGGKISVNSKQNEWTEFVFTLKGSVGLTHKNISKTEAKYTIRHNINFTKEECTVLNVYFESLQALEIYQLTEIKKILSEIKLIKGQNVTLWVVLFENAIYNSDTEQYLKLTTNLC